MGRGNAKKAGKKKADKTPRPRKKPANLRKEAKKKAADKRKKKRTAKARLAPSTADTVMSAARSVDPSATEDAEARFIQPYQATKPYLCPACNRPIAVGVGHMVSVPPQDPELRRHWHRGCWNNRHNLR